MKENEKEIVEQIFIFMKMLKPFVYGFKNYVNQVVRRCCCKGKTINDKFYNQAIRNIDSNLDIIYNPYVTFSTLYFYLFLIHL